MFQPTKQDLGTITTSDTGIKSRVVEPVRMSIIPPLFQNQPTDQLTDLPFKVTTVKQLEKDTNVFHAFNGEVNLAVAYKDDITISVEKTTAADGFPMNLADSIQIVSTKDHAPREVKVLYQVNNEENSSSTTELPPSSVTGTKLVWVPRSEDPADRVLIANMKFKPSVKDHADAGVRTYTFTFTGTYDDAPLDADEIHLHQITIFNTLTYDRTAREPSAFEYENADAIANKDSSCPSMQFTDSDKEQKTSTALANTLSELLQNTQCDDLFQNNFSTSFKADTDASASARLRAEVKTKLGWSGAQADAATDAEMKTALHNSIKATMDNDTLSRATGCEAMSAMMNLATNAQKQATCLINRVNTQSRTESQIVQTTTLTVGGSIIDSDVAVVSTLKNDVMVNFAANTKVSSELATIFTNMLQSVSEMSNGIKKEGLFAPEVSAKGGSASTSQTVSEQARKIVNDVVNEQLTSLKANQTTSLDVGKDIINSRVLVSSDLDISLICGLMVENSLRQHLSSSYMSENLNRWKTTNSAESKGLTFDFLGLLLLPLLIVGGVILFLMLGGPAFILRRMGKKSLMGLGVLLAVGGIVGLVFSVLNGVHIGGLIASIACVLAGGYIVYTSLRSRKSPSL
jgi:hypothetical protein